jgi:phage-related holin
MHTTIIFLEALIIVGFSIDLFIYGGTFAQILAIIPFTVLCALSCVQLVRYFFPSFYSDKIKTIEYFHGAIWILIFLLLIILGNFIDQTGSKGDNLMALMIFIPSSLWTYYGINYDIKEKINHFFSILIK